jgi:sulfur transfer protein SufE
MPEVTSQRRGELVRGVFAILLTAPAGIRAQNLLATPPGNLTLTDHEVGSL